MRHKLTELQGEVDVYTVVLGDFNTPLSLMGKFRRQKISEDMVEFNRSINQLYIIDSTDYLQQNVHFSQAHMGHFPRLTTFWP